MALKIKENEILANHSTFKIGGPAGYFAVVESKDEILEAVGFAKRKNLPFFILGGGSNILFSDKGYDGVIIRIKNRELEIEGSNIKTGAGVPLSRLIAESADVGLAGLEWGIGIPGTVGGAVAGNAGAYGHSISEFVKSVAVLDENGEIKKYSNKDCRFAYRESEFKKSGGRKIIFEIELTLKKGEKEKILKAIREVALKRAEKLPPYPSAGSVFKNIIVGELKNENEFLKLVPAEKIRGGKFPAARLIEGCGLKGEQVGGAKISEEHANFIVNIGGAKAGDALALIELCKRKVREKFGVNLEEEIIVI